MFLFFACIKNNLFLYKDNFDYEIIAKRIRGLVNIEELSAAFFSEAIAARSDFGFASNSKLFHELGAFQ